MKKFDFAIPAAAALLLMFSCQKEEQPPVEPPQTHFTVTADFEDAQLKSVTYDGFTPAQYNNVLEGKSLASICDDEDSWFWDSLFYDGILYRHQLVAVATMFNDGEWMGYGTFDTWSGFAISSNCNAEAGDAPNQFSVYKADNGNNKFAVGYDSPRGGFGEMADYDTPTIILDRAGVIRTIDFMNTTYTAKTIESFDPNVTYVLKAEGYRNGEAAGSLSIVLAENGSLVREWKTVDFSPLGEVDTVRILVDMEKTKSAVQNPMAWLPLYFCIDNIVAEFEITD